MAHILSSSLSILFFVAICKWYYFKISFSKSSLPVYRYTIDFYILNLYSMTLLCSLILSLLFSGSLACQDIGPADFACGL